MEECPDCDHELGFVEYCTFQLGLNKKYEYIIEKRDEITSELATALDTIQFRPVVYDEIEHFQTGVDYPFSSRKSSLPPSMANHDTQSPKMHQILI